MAGSNGIDLRVLELVCARLCHDLVSPVSAVANGVEIINELSVETAGTDPMFGQALTIVEGSSRKATHLLRFLRACYGTGARSLQGGSRELAQIAIEYLNERKINLILPSTGAACFDVFGKNIWDSIQSKRTFHHASGTQSEPIEFLEDDLAPIAKLVLSSLGFLVETLPMGGEIALESLEGGLVFIAKGTKARVKEDLQQALLSDVKSADLAAHTIQGYFLKLILDSYDLEYDLLTGPEHVRLEMRSGRE